MKMDLDALLLQESRRTPDLSGCKSADELLKSVLNRTDGELVEFETEARKLSGAELDQVSAAGGGADDPTRAGRTVGLGPRPGDSIW